LEDLFKAYRYHAKAEPRNIVNPLVAISASTSSTSAATSTVTAELEEQRQEEQRLRPDLDVVVNGKHLLFDVSFVSAMKQTAMKSTMKVFNQFRSSELTASAIAPPPPVPATTTTTTTSTTTLDVTMPQASAPPLPSAYPSASVLPAPSAPPVADEDLLPSARPERLVLPALNERAAKKHEKYDPIAVASNSHFYAAVIEVNGYMHEEFLTALAHVAQGVVPMKEMLKEMSAIFYKASHQQLFHFGKQLQPV
jgi:hypothetical protein